MKASLCADNLLLRGSSLANTEWVLGAVVYAGHDTKVMMNANSARYKLSTIEKDTNRQVFIIFQIQTVLCIVAATFATIWNFAYQYPYLHTPDE